MAKGAYYAGMATAPQVKPADFLTPFQNMLSNLREDSIRKAKEIEAVKKENEKFALSEQDKLNEITTQTAFDSSLASLDIANAKFKENLNEQFKSANMLFNTGQIDRSGLKAMNTNFLNAANGVKNLATNIQGFVTMDDRLAAQGRDSHWNDLVKSWVGDAERNLGFRNNVKGQISLVTLGDDNIERALPTGQIADFFQAREATDLSKVVKGIADLTEGYTFETEKSSVTRYLDYSKNPEGELTQPQLNILEKQLIALDPRDVYDAAVRAGIVGPRKDQIQIITDFNSENLITPEILSQMRTGVEKEDGTKILGLADIAAQELRDMLANKNTSKPKSVRGASGTNKTFAIYDDETGKYSYRRNSQTAFAMKSGFSGKDMINDRPTGTNKDVPPGTNITDIRLTPHGLEIWGTQIKDKEGKTLFTREAASLSAEEVSSMGGTRVNFHKVIDPSSNESAIGELQRIFGFEIDEYKDQLKLNTMLDEESETVVSQDDLSLDEDNERY